MSLLVLLHSHWFLRRSLGHGVMAIFSQSVGCFGYDIKLYSLHTLPWVLQSSPVFVCVESKERCETFLELERSTVVVVVAVATFFTLVYAHLCWCPYDGRSQITFPFYDRCLQDDRCLQGRV